MEKNFDAALREKAIYELWQNSGAFSPKNTNSSPFTIMIPPPNITGSLHIGHALNNAIQDVLIRYNRLKNKSVLWQPGTDHASIATQMVVERQNAQNGLPERQTMGREKFLEKIWEWKKTSGGAITNQLKALGSSCDWTRERFTMDEGMSQAVIKVFVDLYNQNLIYKDTRLVSWDPKMGTAISDLEVVPTEVDGHLWYFAYPIEQSEERIIVATTRPETMLGDTGIAVNPDDARYKHLHGKFAIHPITKRKLRIVADNMADAEHGSGAVKLTPAHDFNDFEAGKRHGLELLTIFDKQAKINENAPRDYQGLSREDARKKIITQMEECGLLIQTDKIRHSVPYGERGGVPVEPLLTEQWYVRADVLAKPALEAVKSGRTKFFPENWANTYYQWLENIQPWCISRQLWWGHRIPAWYGEDGKIFVAQNDQEAQAQADKFYGKPTKITRDEDVLDTWFSSALWPFSTLGWPENTEILQKHYPTDVLVTGFDIIFFWVARMMMFGLHFMKKEPFHTVYVHALVRDEMGRKMSKSKGNVIDPLDMINEFGCDALRFTLVQLSTPGRDIKLAKSRVAISRNFITKLWNGAKFVLSFAPEADDNFQPSQVKNPINQWMMAQLQKSSAELENQLQNYRFDNAAHLIYNLIWLDFCDWYLEFTKPLLRGENPELIHETQQSLRFALDTILKLSHPFMPFVSEEIYGIFNQGKLLINSEYPNLPCQDFHESQAEIGWLADCISAIRSARAKCGIAPHIIMQAYGQLSDNEKQYAKNHQILLEKMAKIAWHDGEAPSNDKYIKPLIKGGQISLGLSGALDVGAEISRLTKEKAKLINDCAAWQAKFANPQFRAKAKEEIIAELETRIDEATEAVKLIQESLELLT